MQTTRGSLPACMGSSIFLLGVWWNAVGSPLLIAVWIAARGVALPNQLGCHVAGPARVRIDCTQPKLHEA